MSGDAGRTVEAAAMTFRGFGLDIASDVDLPELEPVRPARTGAADLRIVRGGPPRPFQSLEGDEPALRRGEGRLVMTFRGVADFDLDLAGGRIVVTPYEGADDRLVRLPLLGPVIAAWLDGIGRLVLHAGAVAREGRAVAFLGDKGAGKSTTSAAFLGRGFELLTDDVLALEPDGDGVFRAEASGRQIKLAAEASEALGAGVGRRLESPHRQFAKELYLARPTDGPAALAGVCLLQRGASLAMERLSAPEALGGLAANLFMTRYGPMAGSPADAARRFRACAALAEAAVVVRLTVPRDLAAIDRVVDLVLDRLGSDLRPA